MEKMESFVKMNSKKIQHLSIDLLFWCVCVRLSTFIQQSLVFVSVLIWFQHIISTDEIVIWTFTILCFTSISISI